MGSGIPKGGVVIRDVEGLVINPGVDQSGGRDSTVSLAHGVDGTAPDGVRVATLIEASQSVTKLWIKQNSGGWYKTLETTTAADTAALTTWQHTSPNQRWVVHDVPAAYVPTGFPWTTKFQLKNGHHDPQDILWVAILATDTFATDHRCYGWTQYPKPADTRGRRGAAKKKASKKKPAPKRRRGR